MSEKNISARSVSVVFALFLGVSIGLHLISALLVAYVWTAPVGAGKVNYLEMRDLVPASHGPSAAMVSRSVREKEPVRQPIPEPSPSTENTAEPEVSSTERKVPENVSATPLGLGMTYGFVSSLGNGATLREDIREYYLVLVEKINKVWWERAGTLSDAIGQDGIAVIVIKRDGTLVDRGISRGTGSREVDQALLDSIDRAVPLPALPASYGQDVFTAPLKITAPSRLMRFTTGKQTD